jgi:hypothetical protein
MAVTQFTSYFKLRPLMNLRSCKGRPEDLSKELLGLTEHHGILIICNLA